jgi:hypothetical protein
MSDIDWASLRHAYGAATDIPALLAQARSAVASADYRAEPWFSLWSALFHQDDIYSASYAAVPELVEIAEARTDDGAIEALFLAAAIERRRHKGDVPPIPPELRSRYDDARTRARMLAGKLHTVGGRPGDERRLAIAEAVFRGDFSRASALSAEDDVDDSS